MPKLTEIKEYLETYHTDQPNIERYENFPREWVVWLVTELEKLKTERDEMRTVIGRACPISWCGNPGMRAHAEAWTKEASALLRKYEP